MSHTKKQEETLIQATRLLGIRIRQLGDEIVKAFKFVKRVPLVTRKGDPDEAPILTIAGWEDMTILGIGEEADVPYLYVTTGFRPKACCDYRVLRCGSDNFGREIPWYAEYLGILSGIHYFIYEEKDNEEVLAETSHE